MAKYHQTVIKPTDKIIYFNKINKMLNGVTKLFDIFSLIIAVPMISTHLPSGAVTTDPSAAAVPRDHHHTRATNYNNQSFP
jgi:hypothetical protein